MFMDRKPQRPQASKQCGRKTSAIPDRHGLVQMMIFVTGRTAVEIVYTLVSTLEWKVWSEGYLKYLTKCWFRCSLWRVVPELIFSTSCIWFLQPAVRRTILDTLEFCIQNQGQTPGRTPKGPARSLVHARGLELWENAKPNQESKF
jgi:hypothetical protein